MTLRRGARELALESREAFVLGQRLESRVVLCRLSGAPKGRPRRARLANDRFSHRGPPFAELVALRDARELELAGNLMRRCASNHYFLGRITGAPGDAVTVVEVRLKQGLACYSAPSFQPSETMETGAASHSLPRSRAARAEEPRRTRLQPVMLLTWTLTCPGV